MGTFAARRLRFALPARYVLPTVAFLVWAPVSIALVFGVVHAPSFLVAIVVTLLIPFATLIGALLTRAEAPGLKLLAGAMAATVAALISPPIIVSDPLLAFAIPAIIAAGMAARKWPGHMTGLAFLFASSYGTVTAFTPFSPGVVVDILLCGLWVGLFLATLLHLKRRAVVVRPEVLGLIGFLALTVVMVFTAPNFDLGLRTFRASAWYMLAGLIVAYGGWKPHAYDIALKMIAVAGVLCGAYATLRWVTGPAAKESALIAQNLVKYNQVVTGEDKVQGALTSGHELGFWAAIVVPFYVAMALNGTGMVRKLSIAAVPLCIIALFGSGQRSGVVGMVAGVTLVLILNQLTRAFKGPRLGLLFTSLALITLVGVLAFPTVVGNDPAKIQRYKNILTPSQDYPFQERLFKWRNAFADIDDYPFGRGLGTGGSSSGQQRFPGLASGEIDNSYVKVAYEQGTTIMILFISALLLLLAGLARRAVWTRSPRKAAIAIAACGAFAAYMITLVGGIYINRLAGLAAWIIVGLALAQFASPRLEDDDEDMPVPAAPA